MNEPEEIILVNVDELALGKYQRMPDRTEAEFTEFAADVKINGIRDPIVIDEENNVLDGHTRVLAARHCKIAEVRAIRLSGLSEQEKLERAYGQSRRRHLSRKQLQEITVAAIKEFPEHSPAFVAKFAPASDRTISKLRAQLIAEKAIPDLAELIGLDGKKHPVEKLGGKAAAGPGGRKAARPDPVVIAGSIRVGRKNITISAEGLGEVQAADEVRIFPTSNPQKLVRESLAAGVACLILPPPAAAS